MKNSKRATEYCITQVAQNKNKHKNYTLSMLKVKPTTVGKAGDLDSLYNASSHPNALEHYLKKIADQDEICTFNLYTAPALSAPQAIGLFAKRCLVKTILKSLVEEQKIESLTSDWELINGSVSFKLISPVCGN